MNNSALEWEIIFDEFKVAMNDYNIGRWIERRLKNVEGKVTKVSSLRYRIRFTKRKRASTIERFFLHTCTAAVLHPKDRLPKIETGNPGVLSDTETMTDYNDFIEQQQNKRLEERNNIYALKRLFYQHPEIPFDLVESTFSCAKRA